MAIQKGNGVDVSMIAGGTISKYDPVKIDTSVTTGGEVIRVTAETDIPYGIAQIDATEGQEVSVRINGVSKMRVGSGTVTVGNLVGIDATDKTEIDAITEAGAGVTLTWAYGVAEASGAENAYVPVRLMMFRTTE